MSLKNAIISDTTGVDSHDRPTRTIELTQRRSKDRTESSISNGTKVEKVFFSMSYSVEVFQAQDQLSNEPHDYITFVAGSIRYTDFKTGNQVDVGRVNAYVVQIGRAEKEKKDLSSIFSCVDEEFESYKSTAIDPVTKRIKSELLDPELSQRRPDLMIVHLMDMPSEFAGQQVDVRLVMHLMQTFGGGCGLTVLNAERSVQAISQAGTSHGITNAKFDKWASHNFKKIEGTHLWSFAMVSKPK